MRLDDMGIFIDQITAYSILKRRNVRYHNDYEQVKVKLKPYCLEYPGMELQLDTLYPFVHHRKFVIYSTIDDCMRIVYSEAYLSANIESTKDFIKELIKRYPFSIVNIRTDQGREFSNTITKYLELLHINHIKNDPYHPEHNGKIERYHYTENMGEVRNGPYLISIEEANYILRNWLFYYNFSRKRLEFGIKKLNPQAKYLEHKDKKRT